MQTAEQLRELITDVLKHLDHVLPGQAPILDFVHHNTLHGFQHLPFEEALEKFEDLTGIHGYLPEARYRNFYQQGRINSRDLDAALTQCATVDAETIVCTLNNKPIARNALYRIALLYDFPALTTSQLQWQIEAMDALVQVQTDVPEAIKQRLLSAESETKAVEHLWHSIVAKLALKQTDLHPEMLLDLAQEQADAWKVPFDPEGDITPSKIQYHLDQQDNQIEQIVSDLFDTVGKSISLRGLVMVLSGVDILDSVRPQLIRFCASAMDEGVAPWTMPEREQGFYAAWRISAAFDVNLFLHELPNWQEVMGALPEDALDTIILHLTHLDIPTADWEGYCQRLALELPGWSGLINWRQQHPDYPAAHIAPISLIDYLAIRLTLDRLWLNQVCHDNWKIDAKLSVLHSYFSKNLAEFSVRHNLYKGILPEYLTHKAELLINQAKSEWHQQPDWSHLADLIHTWKISSTASITAGDHAWRLFRVAQHLGLRHDEIHVLGKEDFLHLLAVLDAFSPTERAKVWLVAYENHYRDAFFQALHANHSRGRWAKRSNRPEAQLIFCMDDREESFRRHLEEHNPALETLGAAGFFGVPMNYKGLDDTKTTSLCPIVVTPINEVQEVPRAGNEQTLVSHQQGRKLLFSMANMLHQLLRSNLLLSQPIINVIAPITLAGLFGKSLFPTAQQRLLAGAKQLFVPAVATELLFNAQEPTIEATLEKPTLGFTDNEQVSRVAGFLRNTGLTYGFSPLVILLGHGSISQNNPHLAAYDCGACSGRHGGPNARLFAAMANRPIIRQMLAERSINIPADTWFIGAEHNTCDEGISWYDLDDIPNERRPDLLKIQRELRHAQRMSAHERCRRLASAPRNPTPHKALQHTTARATDFSQARPELGHATNAAAVIGRRSLTQGAFFDRRVFLISYDPSQDVEGKILEGILLAVGPVGAGINLEYYFSTVNNERFGCGSKVPHNVTGFFGVMEGTSSDLRTGLPQQMVEIHEAMRLQMLVEAKTAVLERIYAEQESLRELIAGGWVHLSAKDPDSGAIFIFEREVGFVPWTATAEDLPIFANSPECYQGQSLPIAPMLIMQP
ncbi:MAG: DUF2309 domain-containing protein [Methylococcaceae bacterium]